MVHKVNQKKEINEMIKLADDLKYINLNICYLALRWTECIDCGECVTEEE